MRGLLLEAVALIAMTLVWWIPTFRCLTDLQGREGVPRVLVWKWTALLCLPVAGSLLYERRGRAELDRAVGREGH